MFKFLTLLNDMPKIQVKTSCLRQLLTSIRAGRVSWLSHRLDISVLFTYPRDIQGFLMPGFISHVQLINLSQNFIQFSSIQDLRLLNFTYLSFLNFRQLIVRCTRTSFQNIYTHYSLYLSGQYLYFLGNMLCTPDYFSGQ